MNWDLEFGDTLLSSLPLCPLLSNFMYHLVIANRLKICSRKFGEECMIELINCHILSGKDCAVSEIAWGLCLRIR